MKATSAVSVVVACLGAMTGFVVLTVRGQDPTPFAMFAGSVILPQAVALFRQDKVQRIQEDATADIAIIKQRTNGPLDRQAEILEDIRRDVKELKGGNDNAGSS